MERAGKSRQGWGYGLLRLRRFLRGEEVAVDREGLYEVIAAQPLHDLRIKKVFSSLDRADFVPPDRVGEAYGDSPVSIPEGQTTSQPSLIARMIDAAAPDRGSRVLEIGTGFGFQTALLALLCQEVVSVERHPELVRAARSNLARVGIGNASVHLGDGWRGWEERAPYDAIIVSAAADSIPEALVEQLSDGGRLVIPLKSRGSDDVCLYVKTQEGLGPRQLVTPARFVPLVRTDFNHGQEGQ